ncbi:KPN_02809 family neutral zinc metallopeptidase [Thermaurantiacus sp.]
MRLDNQRESANIENRRGEGGGLPGLGHGLGARGFGGGFAGLLGAFLPLILSKFGVGGLVVLGLLFLAVNFLGGGGGGPALAPQVGVPSAPAPSGQIRRGQLETETDRFVARVLGSTEDSWGQLFAAEGQRYPPPTLVLFEGAVTSACGRASSASGPFYCPADRKVYLDTAFFDQLARQFGAPGDFAAAYVIAHEVGHHIQTITGIAGQVARAQSRLPKAEANQLQVRMELQADCLAGVWASRNRAILDEGDFAEGVRAAQAIGDDTLMRAAGRRVVPDSFTHGTSEQRVRWLTRGFRSADPDACDTFSIPASEL